MSELDPYWEALAFDYLVARNEIIDARARMMAFYASKKPTSFIIVSGADTTQVLTDPWRGRTTWFTGRV